MEKISYLQLKNHIYYIIIHENGFLVFYMVIFQQGHCNVKVIVVRTFSAT